MNRRLISYTATTGNGIATVITDHATPTDAECAEQIPGYITGTDLGAPTTYTLTYRATDGNISRELDAQGVERIGRVIMRGNVTDIAVTNKAGEDVTFDFACFCQ